MLRIRKKLRRQHHYWAAGLAALPLLLVSAYILLAGWDKVLSNSQAPPAPAGCSGGSLNIVAHEDDDILFMNPDIQHDISAGKCVTTVYMTIGDYGLGWNNAKPRENGSKAAYAEMAGVPGNWQTQMLEINSHKVLSFSLNDDRKINLVFMRLPNAQGPPRGWPAYHFQSLTYLYSGKIKQIDAVDGSASYTLDQLVGTLKVLIDQLRPLIIRVQDFKALPSDMDHSDHIAAAKIGLLANAGLTYPHTLISYYDTQISHFPIDLDQSDINAKVKTWWAYAPFDTNACQTSLECHENGYFSRLEREYISGVIPNF